MYSLALKGYNPYRDAKGRFTTREQALSFLESLPAHPMGPAYVGTYAAGLSRPKGFVGVRVPTITKKMLRQVPIEVEILDLPTPQGWLTKGRVLDLFDLGVEKVKERPVVVVEQDGVKYLTDGNHRAAALLLMGETKVKAIVVPARPPTLRRKIAIDCSQVLKFNPYHDERGRFTSKERAGGSFQPPPPPSKSDLRSARVQQAASLLHDQEPVLDPRDKAAYLKKEADRNAALNKEYKKNPEFRKVADAMTLFAHGQFDAVRGLAQEIAAGRSTPLGDMKVKEALRSVSPPKMFPEQNLAASPDTMQDIVATTIDVLNTSPETTEPLYRGMNFPDGKIPEAITSLKPGDVMELTAFTSFSRSRGVANGFALGIAGVDGNPRPRGRGVVIVVEPGIRALNVAPFSKWNQRESIASGSLEVVSVGMAVSGKYEYFTITVKAKS